MLIKIIKSKRLVVLLFIGLFFLPATGLSSNHQGPLEQEINKKSQELREIHEKLEQTQKNLVETEQKKTTLNRELKKKDYQIQQLNLSIRSNIITIDKLGLEIDSLDIDIEKNQQKIQNKNEAINKILKTLQIKDDESLVESFLKNQSLAQSLDEIHQLTETREALADELDNLRDLKSKLSEKLNQVSEKKQGIEQEYKTSKVRKSITEEQRKERSDLLALAKNQEKIFQQTLEELAERQGQIAEEIEKLERELRQQINPDLLPDFRPGVLAWPIKDGYKSITQNYGSTVFARYGYKGKWHNGVDIGQPIGTAVLSAQDGLIVSIGDQDQYCRRGAYGKFIVVRHNNNLTSLYAHLSQIAVTPGDRVNKGELIGYLGSSGYSTGPHLHFTVYESNTFQMRASRTCGPMPSGGDIDPSKYL